MQRERRKNNDILFHFRKDDLPMTKLSQLKIDSEFQKQINPPSFEETHQLEMNILKEERVLNPIITWNGYIVDGHTRYQILRKYPCWKPAISMLTLDSPKVTVCTFIRARFARSNSKSHLVFLRWAS